MKPRYEPALRHGALVGLVVVGLSWIGIAISDEERLALDSVFGLLIFVVPVLQGLVQGWLTRRRVVPVAKLNDSGRAATNYNL